VELRDGEFKWKYICMSRGVNAFQDFARKANMFAPSEVVGSSPMSSMPGVGQLQRARATSYDDQC
jgi:hypothetical protein